MLFRPKDRKYTAKEVQKKADGYAMAYIKRFKEAIEQSFNTFKTSVTNKINTFSETLIKYFDLENGEFYKRSKYLDEKYNNFTDGVDGKIEKKADKATTLNGYGITDAYTKGEVEALSGQNIANIEAKLNMDYYDKDDADSMFAKKEDLSKVTGKVESVNGQTGKVTLTASDVRAYTKEETNSNISGAIDTNIGILRADIANDLSYKVSVPTYIDAPNVQAGPTLVLKHNQEACLSELQSLVISFPNSTGDIYHSNFSIISGSPAISLNYSSAPMNWVGDDCDADGAFVPEPNTKYEVCVKKLGGYIVARVGAY